jgi:pimeloyl-ACP methyl ester carboxylesterase
VADPLVESAIAHWAPRFLQNGVDYNDFVATTARIATWEQWLPEWCATADRSVALAAAAEALAHRRTAGALWLRAAVARHFAKFVWLVDERRHAEATLACVAELLTAHRLLGTGAERIEAPLDGAAVVANLRRPPDARRPPLVVLVPGLDSTKEEFFHLEKAFLERRMATLSLDGAGQGEVGLSLPIRHDYEACVGAMLDRIEDRDDLDLARLGIFGVSLGGYYAARAAAFEPRIRALVGLSGPYAFGELWDELPSLTSRAFTVKARARSDDEGRACAAALDLTGVCRLIGAPALFVAGDRDTIIPSEQTERAARETPGATFRLAPGGNHGCSNLTPELRPAIADWMSDQLRDAQATTGS